MNIKIKKLNKQQLIGIIVAAVVVIVLAVTGITCAVRDESPSDLAKDIFTSDSQQLMGKWQDEKAATGYEFFEDGSYDSYILGASTRGTFTISGNKLTLRGTVVYKYSVTADTLTLTLLDADGKKDENEEVHTYKRVDHFNFKSLTELIQDLADDAEEETEEATEETTEAQE